MTSTRSKEFNQWNLKRKRKSQTLSPPTLHKIHDPIRENSSFHNKSPVELSSHSKTFKENTIRKAYRKPQTREKELSSDDSDDLITLIGTKIVVTDTSESDEEKIVIVPDIRTKQANTRKPNPHSLTEKFNEQKFSKPQKELSSDSEEDYPFPTTKTNNSNLSDSIIETTDDEEYVPRKKVKSESEEEFNEQAFEPEVSEEEVSEEEVSEEEVSEEEGSEEESNEEIEECSEKEEDIVDSDEGIELDSEMSEVEIKTKKTQKKKRVPISADQLKASENGWSYDVENDHYVLSIGDDLAGFVVSSQIFEKLYHHQQIGLKWLAERHLDTNFCGGLLADQMGLGKTIQISALIHGLFLREKASRILIICPNSVIGNWQRELRNWSDQCIQGIVIFHQVGGDKSTNKKRVKLIEQFNRYAKLGGAVMLSTYQTISNHVDFFKDNFKDDTLLDSVVLDEAHKVKNRDAKCSIALKTLPSKSRFALTGTPIMNRLTELYSIFSWIFGDTLLGTHQEFNESFAIAINNSTKRDATAYEKMLGNQAADSLRETIQPYLMMRDKNSVLSIDNQLYKKEDQSTTAKIGQKNDLVVWCSLTADQINWYEDYLSSEQVKEVLNRTLNPLVGIIVLKQICDHNLMCSGYEELLKQKKEELKKELMEEQIQDEDMNDFIDDTDANLLSESATPSMSMTLDMDDLDEKKKRALQRKLRQAQEEMVKKRIRDEPVESILSSSVKAQLVQQLVEKSVDEGHKVLIFSQYTRMLDIISVILKNMNIKYNRIDGSVTKYQDRLDLVDSFNQKKNIKCFLLSSQAGGVGLNLTAASRVILVEPNFNPSIDDQAIDRCYRIGQKQNVIVYRLICCSTIEEYIYKRQVSKTTVSRTAVIASNQYRYLRHSDLLEMFTLGDTTISETCNRFNKIHEKDRRDADGLEEHIKSLKEIPSVVGISDHDVLFCNQADDINEDQAELEEERRRAQIERVQRIRDFNRNNAIDGIMSSKLMFRLDDIANSGTVQALRDMFSGRIPQNQ